MDFVSRFSEKLTSSAVRIVLIGSSCVGKTSLCTQFVNRFADSGYERTDELRPFRNIIDISTNSKKAELVLLQIDDVFPINHPDLISSTKSINYDSMSRLFDSILQNKRLNPKRKSGNPMFDEMPVHIYFFVFDASDRDSFEELEPIIEFVNEKEEKRRNRTSFRPTHKVIIANKNDLDVFAVPVARIEAIKRKVEASFRKLSAFDNSQVQHLFIEATQAAISKGLVVQISDTRVSTNISIDSSLISDLEDSHGEKLQTRKRVQRSGVRQVMRRCGCTGGDDCIIM